ncbi:mRNA decay activator protein ZFP36L2 isoform X3 [Nematostella vectensis]|uniref:mRNA decay activator protein ZFP36L2 isoform X3 n=1 Tax=Nematostella vectensis TaxID=45351 RepID=UPI00207723A7|nr:mRNA decay activator protein ZFP36L2 isoform X3 [Nematostella vectensis]
MTHNSPFALPLVAESNTVKECSAPNQKQKGSQTERDRLIRLDSESGKMSTALVSAFYDITDVVCKNNRNMTVSNAFEYRQKSERRMINVPSLPRRHSTNSSTVARQSPNLITLSGITNKPRERSLSLTTTTSLQTEDDRRRGSQNSSRYKTELCRPFEESGTCKYGDKCQFAHGYHELRQLARHPKYKTELCRTFHTIGFCPYGPRCHFIHNADEKRAPPPNSSRLSPPLSPLNGPPSPPLTEPSSPLPTSLTPPSPLQFYDESPLSSPIDSPLPVINPNSPSVNNVFTFPTKAQEYTPVISPSAVSSPRSFSPAVTLETVDEREDLPPTPPDVDAFGRRRLPVFNSLGYK